MLKPALNYLCKVAADPAAFGRLRVETGHGGIRKNLSCPAAFGRLRVETVNSCALNLRLSNQLPSGGCVLKHLYGNSTAGKTTQLPSGGCVLKHPSCPPTTSVFLPAAFGRLRVETLTLAVNTPQNWPAAFGRLRVETVLGFLVSWLS